MTRYPKPECQFRPGEDAFPCICSDDEPPQGSEDAPWLLFDTSEGAVFGPFPSLGDAYASAIAIDLHTGQMEPESTYQREAERAAERLDLGYFQAIWWDVKRHDDPRDLVSPC